MVAPLAVAAVGAGVAGLASVISALIGKAQSEGLNERERQELQRALREFEGIQAPELQRLEAEQLGPSALEGVQVDPRYRDAQLRALSELETLGRGTGLTLEDRAALEDTGEEARRAAEVARRRIASTMAARGAFGGGQELALQAQGAADATQQAYKSSRDAYAQARGRALDSILKAGQLGGQVRGQEWGEQAQRAGAADERTRWNATQRQRMAERNAGLGQEAFENRLRLASARANPRGALAGTFGRQAERERDWWAGMGGAASGAIGAGTNAYLASQGPQSYAGETERERQARLKAQGF